MFDQDCTAKHFLLRELILFVCLSSGTWKERILDSHNYSSHLKVEIFESKWHLTAGTCYVSCTTKQPGIFLLSLDGRLGSPHIPLPEFCWDHLTVYCYSFILLGGESTVKIKYFSPEYNAMTQSGFKLRFLIAEMTTLIT